jgi:hypothetical protein
MSARLEAALAWVALGLPVFPLFEVVDGRCACRRSECIGATRGKHPRVLGGLKTATCDETTIRKWFGRLWPESNIGIRTGAPGIVALDLDSREAASAFLELVDERPIGGLVIATGRGRQIWWHAPAADDIPNSTALGGIAGLDVRGRGGYVVAPPSRHYTGLEYHVAGGQLDPLPDWLHAELRTRPRATTPIATARPACAGDGTPFGLAVLGRECAELQATSEGSRNRKLNLVSYLAGRLVAGGELSEAYAASEITSAAYAIGLEPVEVIGRDGESGTLWSGIRAGQRSPLTEAAAPDAMPEKAITLLAATSAEELFGA